MTTQAPLVVRHYLTIRNVLALAYIAGVIGLQIPALVRYFEPLSPVTLLVSLALLLCYHTDWNRAFSFYAMLALLTGYFVEVVGVHTGLIFGRYAYGTGLGFRVLEVPPVIGINWLILSYCCGSVCNRLPWSRFGKVVAAATLMVVLDVFIEPVAVHLNFWHWYGQPVPLQNYIGWWVVSAFLFTVYYVLPFQKENRLAKWLLVLQFIFFIGHNLFMFLL